MNNYNCLKTKFKNIPIGTWFTYADNICKSYYFKIKEIKEYYNEYIDPVNAVIMEGPSAGILTVFDDDEEVYWGKI